MSLQLYIDLHRSKCTGRAASITPAGGSCVLLQADACKSLYSVAAARVLVLRLTEPPKPAWYRSVTALNSD